MKLHHLRNATFVIESGENHILIDPMLGEKGSLPPFVVLRHKARRNPTVSLPENAQQVLDKVNLSLVTHSQKWGIGLFTHTDHFDDSGRNFLKENDISVVCSSKDASFMKNKGLKIQTKLSVWQPKPLLDGQITAIPALHGHGWIHALMANGIGFFIELPDEPSIYISGDTVYTDDVHRALTELKPDVAVLAAGSAGLDVGGHILMPKKEIVTFIENAPGKVVANHMDALNHCPTTRKILKDELGKTDLLSKTIIPADGETVRF